MEDDAATEEAEPTLPIGQITPEEAERRRKLAENAARGYARWHPSIAPKRNGTGFARLFNTFNPLVTLASLALFIVLEKWRFGWPLAIGTGIVILLHECGHAAASLMKRIPVTGIILLPFLGGVALRARRGDTAADDAFIGIMGPIFGVAAGLICWGLYPITQQRFFLSLADLVMAMHFLNMLPISPLDGSRVLPLFHRQKRGVPDPYYQTVTDTQRWKYGALYIGIALFCLSAVIILRPYADIP